MTNFSKNIQVKILLGLVVSGSMVFYSSMVGVFRPERTSNEPAAAPAPSQPPQVAPEPGKEETYSAPSTSNPAEDVPVYYKKEDKFIDIYENIKAAGEHKDLEWLGRRISTARLSKMNEYGEESYVEIVLPKPSLYQMEVEAVIDRQHKNRGLLIVATDKEFFIDIHGRPLPAYEIFQFVREDGNWKLHSRALHRGPVCGSSSDCPIRPCFPSDYVA